MNEKTFKSGRLARLTTFGKLVAKTSGKLSVDLGLGAIEQFQKKKDEIKQLQRRIEIAKEVVSGMGEMKGGLMKLGQMISITEDLVLPPEIADIFKSLQKNAPPMSSADRESVFLEAFGKPAEEVFAKFDPNPMAQASIGQVHRAVLKSGEKVVVKVQYPQIKKAVATDLKGLDSLDGLLGKLFPSKPNLDSTIAELKETLISECDYRLEQKNMEYAKKTLAKEFPQILIPEVYPECSTETVLTMEEMKGMSFDETLNASQAERNEWGQILFDANMYGLYENLFLHTDPQNGNYLFTPGKIILLDFGSCRFFPEEFVRDYTLLLRSLENRSFEDYRAWMKRMGYFTDEDGDDIIREHYTMIGELYWPHTEAGVFALQSQNPFEQARSFIKKVSIKGRKAPRPEFILLDRSNIGLYTKLKAWRSEIDWISARDRYRLSRNF